MFQIFNVKIFNKTTLKCTPISASHCCQSYRNVYFCKSCICKCIVFKSCQLFRQNDLRQCFAHIKSVAANFRQGRWQRHIRQTGAVFKCIPINIDDPFFNNDFFNNVSIRLLPESAGHLAAATDGQDTLAVQRPGHGIAAASLIQNINFFLTTGTGNGVVSHPGNGAAIVLEDIFRPAGVVGRIVHRCRHTSEASFCNQRSIAKEPQFT